MTYAKWEKNVRLLDDHVMIWTETDTTGQVISAFTAHGETWQLKQA
jgi:hypothetical protein